MRVKKLPMILALHLKRFKYMEQYNRHIKVSHRVVFPLELRLFNTVSSTKYRLSWNFVYTELPGFSSTLLYQFDRRMSWFKQKNKIQIAKKVVNIAVHFVIYYYLLVYLYNKNISILLIGFVQSSLLFIITFVINECSLKVWEKCLHLMPEYMNEFGCVHMPNIYFNNKNVLQLLH